MRCCRCRLILLFQTALVLLTIYYFLFSGLLDWTQESMEVITTTTTDMTTKMEEWDEVVAKMGVSENCNQKRLSRNLHLFRRMI